MGSEQQAEQVQITNGMILTFQLQLQLQLQHEAQLQSPLQTFYGSGEMMT